VVVDPELRLLPPVVVVGLRGLELGAGGLEGLELAAQTLRMAIQRIDSGHRSTVGMTMTSQKIENEAWMRLQLFGFS
jgi:hypothetical protein